MAWTKFNNVTLTSGSREVTVNDGTSVAEILAGFDLVKDGLVYELDTPSAGNLMLVDPWPNATEASASIKVRQTHAPIAAQIHQAIQRLSSNSDTFETLKSAAFKQVATLAEAKNGAADVLPDAAGVLAAIRQFGLGNDSNQYAGPTEDANNYKTAGVFYANFTNAPSNSTAFLSVDGSSGNRVRQTWRDSVSRRTESRFLDGGVWSEWGRDDLQAFGLGDSKTSPLINNLGSISHSGFSHGDGGATAGPVTSTVHGVIRVNGRSENEYALIDIDILRQNIYLRTKGTGSPDQWVELFHTLNLQPENTDGIGVVRLMQNVSGSTISNGSSTSASSLKFTYAASNGAMLPHAAITPSGTWKNVTGQGVGHTGFGWFVRIV